jgi:pSer/pThr/pTyr-binding forkhead associated (FHA) protein
MLPLREAKMKCQSCRHEVEPGHRFCGACGQAIRSTKESRAAESVYAAAPEVGRARLRLIRGDSTEGALFELNDTSHYAGRSEGPILFPDDLTVSPIHASFYYADGRLFVRDEGSRNGTFIRVKEPVPVADGEVFLVGEQVLRHTRYNPTPVRVGDDGAVFCGTPVTPWTFRIEQLHNSGEIGQSHCIRDSTVSIGRDDCDINFPHDRFISHHHARLEVKEHETLLKDLKSRNGTYFRIKSEVPLSNGDYVFIGRQLLRVEFL